MYRQLFLSGLISIAASDSHFFWPKELHVITEGQWNHIDPRDAPPHFYMGGLPDDFAEHADAVYVDLRDDGYKELFINNGGGGSAGRGWSIYDKASGQWKLIGIGCGIPTICEKSNGYHQIEVWSRGGAGTFTRELLRFQNGRYHLVRLEDWKDADDYGHRVFVEARDPKPFDDIP